jgi:hypothetical protein
MLSLFPPSLHARPAISAGESLPRGISAPTRSASRSPIWGAIYFDLKESAWQRHLVDLVREDGLDPLG